MSMWLYIGNTAISLGVTLVVLVVYLVWLRQYYRQVPFKTFSKHVALNIGNFILFFGGSILIYLELLYFHTGGNFDDYSTEEITNFLIDKNWIVMVYHMGFLVVLHNSYEKYFLQERIKKEKETLKKVKENKKEQQLPETDKNGEDSVNQSLEQNEKSIGRRKPTIMRKEKE